MPDETLTKGELKFCILINCILLEIYSFNQEINGSLVSKDLSVLVGISYLQYRMPF